jgi:hypothetical protein
MSNAVANQLYLAYLGRPADTAWRSSTTAVLAGGAPSVALQNAFYSAAVLDGTFSLTDSSSSLVNKIFLNIFGFAASTFEQNAWATLINNGTITAQTAAWTIFSSYLGATNVPSTYQQPAQSKLIAIEAYTTQLGLDSNANVAVSQLGSTAATSARSFITSITSQATAAAATTATAIASTVAGVATGNTGGTFVLTTGLDTITGTAGNDTINAPAGTFQALDAISGGTGTDTLSLVLTGAYTGGVSISGVERLVINTTTSNFTAAGITGLTDISSSSSTADPNVTGIGNLVNLAVSNQDVGSTFVFADSAVSGTADSTTLTLSNFATATSSTININNTTTLTGTNGLETLNIVASGAVGSSAANATLATNATQSLTKINISGSGAVSSLVLGANVTTTATTIDASASTGGVSISGFGAATHTVTGGSGSDSFNFAGNYTSADSVSGGAGTDTLAATAANLVAITTKLTNVTSIETIRVTDAAATNDVLALGNFGATNARLAAQTNAMSVTGLASGASVRFDGAQAGTTLTVTDATLPGTTDTLSLDLRGAGVTYTTTIAGVETLNVNASNSTGTSTLGLTATALTTLNITNTSANTVVTGTLGASVATVTAAAVVGTGAVTITLNGTANNGANVTGSGNADTITGSNLTDVINGGAGGDTITGGDGADRLTGGAGNDIFTYAAASNTGTVTGFAASTAVPTASFSTTNLDVVSDFANGDTVSLTGVTAAGTLLKNGATLGANTVGDVVLLRGTYDATANTFIGDTSGTSSVLVWDSNGTTAGGTTYVGIVLVGYVDTGAADTVAAGAPAVFTAVA